MPQQQVWIDSEPSVSLEAVYKPGASAPGGAVILHPHPQYGGSMDNNVVEALARGAAEAGWASLRFNFRGVGGSSGQHGGGGPEAGDVAAAAQWLRQRQQGPVALLGYSFGAYVGSLAAAKVEGLHGGFWVSPPLIIGPLEPWPAALGPLLMACGERDQFTDLAGLETYARQQGAHCSLSTYAEVDHFWWGRESELKSLTSRFLANLAQPAR